MHRNRWFQSSKSSHRLFKIKPRNMARRLIITADDMGYNVERNQGIVECFARKGVTNASVMVNGLACEQAARLAREHGLPTGLHFNIAEGVPVDGAQSSYTTLTKSDGHFLDVLNLRKAAVEGKIDKKEVKAELKRQISRYVELFGRKPLYADGHEHGHMFPGVVEAFAETLAEEGILATRLPYELDLASATWNHDHCERKFFSALCDDAEKAKPVLRANSIWTSDAFYGLNTMGQNMTAQRLQTGILKAFASLADQLPQRPITCELMTHPGFACRGGVGGCGEGADEFSRSSDREHEKSVLESAEMQEFYKENDITLMAYDECYRK